MHDHGKSGSNEAGGSPSARGFEESQFERALDGCASWAIRYLESLQDRPVSEEVAPNSIRDQLDCEPPMEGIEIERWGDLLSDVESIVEPGLVHWQSPRFFAYFPCNSSMPGIMGDFVSSVLNVNGMLWSSSPSSTEVEMKMMDWCARMFGLPDCFRFDGEGSQGGGCIQGTASESVLSVISAARRRMVRKGKKRGDMCVYTSIHAHSSIMKGAMVCGLADGPEDNSRVRLIPSGDGLEMDPELLMCAIQKDLDDGLSPCMVCVSRGTTSTGAMDPLREIGEKLKEYGEDVRPWLHVDAAWAGAAAVCPEYRFVLDGIEFADSLCVNPHKWLLTNFDCDLFWVRDREDLIDSMSITPAYLRDKQSESGEVIDFRDWHVPLGRKFRSMKLWFVIRWFGVEGLRAHIRHHVKLAQRFERFVQEDDRLELACDRSLALVCFSVLEGSERTKQLIEMINARRVVMVSHTMIAGDHVQDQWIARVAIGSSKTSQKDIDLLIEEIRAVLDEIK